MIGSEIDNQSKKINLRFFGPIIGIVGRSSDAIKIESEETTIKRIIRDLCDKYGKKFEDIAIHNGTLNPGLIVFVNGVHVTEEDRKLSCSDEVQVMIASQMKGG